MFDADRTASLMTPAKLAQVKPRAPVSPAAWLDQMASDAGHAHVRRLAELRADLALQAGKRDPAPLSADLAALAAALPRLDFGLLQQKKGLLARLAGKGKGAGAAFAAQFDGIEEAMDALSGRAKSLQAQGEQAAGMERTLVELEVEFRAIEKIIDQGARWLQDMRLQLKTREAQGGDEAVQQKIREDAQRCELLVARLKQLRAVATAAHETHKQSREAASRRVAFVQSLQAALAPRMRDWRSRVAPLANGARDGDAPALGLEGPMEAHRELQLALKQAIAEAGHLQASEQALAAGLDALVTHLQAAA